MTKVIFNPQAGRARAARRLPDWLQNASSEFELQPTSHPGHAVELARQAALDGDPVVIAAGGDGTVHEVANGLLLSERNDVVMAVVPIGSANDFAFSLKQQFGESQLHDEHITAIDVGVLEADGRRRFFIESVGMGLSAQVTLESRRIHRLQGLMLYGLAAVRALWKHRPQSLSIAWDEEPCVEQPTLMLTVMLGQREGNFILAPQASMNDGLFDVVQALQLSRWGALRLLPSLAKHGPPTDHPQVALRQCHGLSVESPTPLTIHTDGEMFCETGDQITNVSIRLIPQRLRVKVCAL